MEPKTLVVGLIEVNSVILFWSGLILGFLSGRWMLAGVTTAIALVLRLLVLTADG